MFLQSKNMRSRILVLEILAGLCLVQKAHSKVLDALDYFAQYAGERGRFDIIVRMLRSAVDLELQATLLSFINVVIIGRANNLKARAMMRYEFLSLGLRDVLEVYSTICLWLSARCLVLGSSQNRQHHHSAPCNNLF